MEHDIASLSWAASLLHITPPALPALQYSRTDKQANAQNAASLSVMCNYGDIYHFATGGGNDFEF